VIFVLDACFVKNPDPAAGLVDDAADVVYGNGRFPDHSLCCHAWDHSFHPLQRTWHFDDCGRVIYGVVVPEKIKSAQEETL
jgi:hypothetical protein